MDFNLQHAILNLKNGDTLYIPPGTYYCAEPLNVGADDIKICGGGKTTHIIYTREQTDEYTSETASLFVFKNGIKNVTLKDLKLQYTGFYFPEFGQSYDGKVNGILFGICENILIDTVELLGFNANAIFVSGPSKDHYSKDFRVTNSYLHHNRVAGVLYGYVDGIKITNCVLEYMGSQLDGGTGYGCAGSSGGHPLNIEVRDNRANYNWRKGIDLHAGENAVIENNICRGNRLYGIYTEGPRTTNVIIRGNIISDMYKEKLDIGEPYTWINGISVGTYSENNEKAYNYEITGNIITSFGLKEGNAYPIYVYNKFAFGKINISDNIIDCDYITNVITIPGTEKEPIDFKVKIENNRFMSKNCASNIIHAGKFTELSIANNIITTDVQNDPVIYTNKNTGVAIKNNYIGG